MTARRLTLGFLMSMVVAAYVIPAIREERIFWFAPTYHPEYYNGLPLPFTGYAYPVLLVLLFVAAAAPQVIAPRLPGASGSVGSAWSRFTLLFLGVIAVVFIIWLVLTPIF